MHIRRYWGFAPLAVFAIAGSPLCYAADPIVVPDPQAVHFEAGPPSLPKGTRIAMVQGDPAKPGPFVLRLTFPAHTDIAPHTHSADENLTILSGDIYHEVGRTMDKGRGTLVKTGGFVYLPANMPHSLWTADHPVELQVTGTGPFGLNYVNPADDPAKKS